MAVLNKNKIKAQPPATVQNFPIVAIGASAGGLDAFKLLVTAIPENSGMAYVLVQHLDPSHESILPDILQRVTKIPVHEITEDIHLAPNHIYVIPSNKILTSTDGVLQMKVRNKKIINHCIDIFFTSLAGVHKEFAVGIVLSGTGSDGTLGLKAIKEHGGICIAQDPQSAAYDKMPKSAVDAGVVDYILAPEKIPAHLKQIVRGHLSKAEKELPTNDTDIFNQILLLLGQRSGVDFTNYKEPTFHRRIARRIAIVKKKNLADYLNFLRSDNAEQDALFQDVLIPVTSFFRDPKTFQTLTETVFPALFKNKAADLSRRMDIQRDESPGMDIQQEEPIRVWIAGCSTGEEAFSIAICLHEYLTLNLSKKEGDYFNPYVGGRGDIQIFASDISEKAIKKARAAIFKEADVAMLSAVQLKNYFVKNIGGYKVNKIIRDMCVFAQHNFLKDPPFAKMDLITCRNVLIYMDSILQKKAFTNFHYALKENGFLLLGKSETIGASAGLFTQVSSQDKIYLRKPTPGRFMPLVTERRETAIPATGKSLIKNETVHIDFRKRAEEIMILKAPASVVVNEAMDIVHIYGDITPFLQQPQGKPTHNVIKMAREGLAFELRNAFQKVIKEQAPVTTENVLVKASALSDPNSLRDGPGKQLLVTVEIIPLADIDETHYLIRFEKKTVPVVQEKKKSSPGKIIESSRKLLAHNQQLEKELLQTREYMLSITEDMETANEELQNGNEELQSSNEEMQSLNEELETSKEELQSSNEELIIVNQELLDKQEQLNASHLKEVEARERIEASEKEQKKLAMQLKLATDSAKVGVWSLDIGSSKLEWSNIHKKMWGYEEHREDLAYEDWHKLILPEDKELAFSKIEASRVNHEIYDVEYRISRANDGAIVWMKSSGQYYYDQSGKAHTLTGISTDITEQKGFTTELEIKVMERTAELQNANEELKQTNLQLDQFAHIASHDLQEPLRKIITFSMRLQDMHKAELSSEVKSYLNKIEIASSRMSTLVRDLLNFSRLLQHEKLFMPTDLNGTITNILDDFELLVLEKEAQIKFDKLPTIDAIPLQMNQLFYNLIINALKFSKKEVPPVITITSRTLTKKEIQQYPAFNPFISYVEIIFKDNGIGFEQQYAGKIFIIFQRLHDKETYKGTGIGLALTKKIIENHHGEIFANAKKNEGAEFHIILPTKQPI